MVEALSTEKNSLTLQLERLGVGTCSVCVCRVTGLVAVGCASESCILSIAAVCQKVINLKFLAKLNCLNVHAVHHFRVVVIVM